MKRGRRGGRGDAGSVGGAVIGPREGVGAVVEYLRTGFDGVVGGVDGDWETRSIIRAILSSSSGHMSGQCVNPKYT